MGPNQDVLTIQLQCYIVSMNLFMYAPVNMACVGARNDPLKPKPWAVGYQGAIKLAATCYASLCTKAPKA